jgi:predicted dehydrogenase
MDIWPNIFVTKAAPWSREGKTESWERMSGDPGLTLPESERSSAAANRRVVDDWIEAIRKDREPVCSGKAGMRAIEMVMAVYQAAIAGRRVSFPLVERKHPLTRN